MLAVLAVSLHLCFLQLNQAGATEHRRTYITLPSPPSVLNHGPPIPSLCLALALSRCLWLCPTLPLSTQFLLDGESCNTHYREQLGWRIFSYLPIPAEKGEGREEKKIPFSGSDLSTTALSSVSSLRRCIGCPLVFLMEYEWLQQLSFCHQLPCTISACSFLPEDTIVVCSMKM